MNQMSVNELYQLIYRKNLQLDRAEVLLSNLLALKSEDYKSFAVPFEDVITTLESVIFILASNKIVDNWS